MMYERVDADEETIREAIRALECYYQDTPAWFVGSRVDGDPRPDSDLDIVVQKEPTRRKNPDGNTGCGRYIGRDDGPDIDITEDIDGPLGTTGQVRIW